MVHTDGVEDGTEEMKCGVDGKKTERETSARSRSESKSESTLDSLLTSHKHRLLTPVYLIR